MSYSRWSTRIKNTVPWSEKVFLFQNGVGREFINKLEHRRHDVISEWYCFDSVNGCASVWHVSQIVDWAWDDLLWAYLTDTVEDAYESPTQIEFLYEVVYEMLEDHYNE